MKKHLKFIPLLILAAGLFIPAAVAQRPRVIIKDLPTPTPAVSPTPVAVSPTPSAVSPRQTLPLLRSRLITLINRPETRRGHIGVKIVSLDSGRTVFEQNGEKYFVPASNMKVLTVAAALDKLGPGFRFRTSVYAPAKPDENATVRGDLTIYGRGDVSISTASAEDGGAPAGLDQLVEKIRQTGVKRIEGDLVGDESYFLGNALPAGWEWDDLQWYYGAGVSALSLNDNAIRLSVKPGPAGGAFCDVRVEPVSRLVKIINLCTTAPGKRTLRITKKLGQDIIEVSGTMPTEDGGFRGHIAVSEPAALFIEQLRRRLEQQGIVITGRNRIVSRRSPPSAVAAAAGDKETPSKTEIARLESPPLSIIAQKILKPSQNLYTEILLRTLGEESSGGTATDPETTSHQKGITTVRNFLQKIGAAPDSVVQYDGSGLSRHNLVTPNTIVRVYEYMARSRHSVAFGAALTIGGIDGTLKNRFRGTGAEANVRGKTGTLNQVSSLSGYVTSATGERFVFAVMINGVSSTALRRKILDEVVLALAGFEGRTGESAEDPGPVSSQRFPGF